MKRSALLKQTPSAGIYCLGVRERSLVVLPCFSLSLFFLFLSLSPSFLELLKGISGEDLSWPENVQVFDRCWTLSKAQWLLENEGIGHVVVVPESFSDGSPLASTLQVLQRCCSYGL